MPLVHGISGSLVVLLVLGALLPSPIRGRACPSDLPDTQIVEAPPAITVSHATSKAISIKDWAFAAPDGTRVVYADKSFCTLRLCDDVAGAPEPRVVAPLKGCDDKAAQVSGFGTTSGCFKLKPAPANATIATFRYFATCHTSGDDGRTLRSQPVAVRVTNSKPTCPTKTAVIVKGRAASTGAFFMPAFDSDGDMTDFSVSGLKKLNGSLEGCVRVDMDPTGTGEASCSKWKKYAPVDNQPDAVAVPGAVRYNATGITEDTKANTTIDTISYSATDSFGKSCDGKINVVLRVAGRPTIDRIYPADDMPSHAAPGTQLLAVSATLSDSDPENAHVAFLKSTVRSVNDSCVRLCSPVGFGGLGDWLRGGAETAGAPTAQNLARCVSGQTSFTAYPDQQNPRKSYAAVVADTTRCAPGKTVTFGVTAYGTLMSAHKLITLTIDEPQTVPTTTAAPASSGSWCSGGKKSVTVVADSGTPAKLSLKGARVNVVDSRGCGKAKFAISAVGSDDTTLHVAPYAAAEWPDFMPVKRLEVNAASGSDSQASCTLRLMDEGFRSCSVAITMGSGSGDAPTTTTTTAATTTAAPPTTTTTTATTTEAPQTTKPVTTTSPSSDSPAPPPTTTTTTTTTDAPTTTETPPNPDSPTTTATTTTEAPNTDAPTTTTPAPTKRKPNQTTLSPGVYTPDTTSERAVSVPFLLFVLVAGLGAYYFRADIAAFIEQRRHGGAGYQGAARSDADADGRQDDDDDLDTPRQAAPARPAHTSVSVPAARARASHKDSDDDDDGDRGREMKTVGIRRPMKVTRSADDKHDKPSTLRRGIAAKRAPSQQVAVDDDNTVHPAVAAQRAASGGRPAAPAAAPVAAPKPAGPAGGGGWDVDEEDWD